MDLRHGKYVMLKAGTVRGVDYRVGDAFDHEGLSTHKIGQMLAQRWIRPAGPTDDEPLPAGAVDRTAPEEDDDEPVLGSQENKDEA